MAEEENIMYRVVFHQDGKVYEIYADYISEESLVGFLEMEDLIFSDMPSGIVLDPSEEKLRQEFKGVKRTYIPIHLVIRIDEIVKEGVITLKEVKGSVSNISHFPSSRIQTPPGGDQSGE